MKQAKAAADLLESESADPFARVQSMYIKAYGRKPSKAEADRAIAYVEAEGMVGGNFVMQAARFFGINKEYENDWKISVKTTAPKTDQDWIDAGAKWMVTPRAGETMVEFKRRVEVALR
jgi:hypothetical protein